MPNTVTGTHTAAPGPASLPSPWQMWPRHDAGLRAVTSAAPAWPLAQPSSRGWKSPINNHYAVVTAPKESPREPLCGLPHRFSSPGMLGVGVGRCSALEAKGIHPLGLWAERTQRRPLGLFLPRLGRSACNGIRAQPMALLLICEANRMVSTARSLAAVSEPLLRRRPAAGGRGVLNVSHTRNGLALKTSGPRRMGLASFHPENLPLGQILLIMVSG